MEPEVVVAWIESIRDEVTVSEACTWLGIARATYYRWKQQWRQSAQKLWRRKSVSFAPS
ncbi:helix-turn-helix domain-containing protein [Paenibacillus polymyxa]|uniref:helix-turn-helix domain-containing protein n=1 Tax=Paenibacillus polymyxa TaxID=1406 RepID=UPI0035A2E2F7